jgi:hypothetical protein
MHSASDTVIQSLILSSSRAAIHQGRSAEVVVTGMINRNVQQGTTATIVFSAHSLWASYPVVNSAAYLSVGLSSVS